MIYVALLYSVVLGGGRRVVMSDLREMAEGLGFEHCRTLVSTGNLVFEATVSPIGDLENVLEASFEKRFGRHVDIIVRSGPDWLKLSAGNPFPDRESTQIGVRIVRKPLTESVIAVLEKHRTKEKIALIEGDPWIDFGGPASGSRLLSKLTTNKLGIGTMRNANTVSRLAEMIC